MQKGEYKMKRLYWIALIEVLVLFVGLSPARAESETKPKTRVADKFKVSWSSIVYDKKVSVHNPAVKKVSVHRPTVSEGKDQQVSETLTLCL